MLANGFLGILWLFQQFSVESDREDVLRGCVQGEHLLKDLEGVGDARSNEPGIMFASWLVLARFPGVALARVASGFGSD